MKLKFLSANTLKLFACLSMAIDHIGLLLFPGEELYRFIGRLAMPIFAFFIAEGCRKTSSIGKYFLRTFSLGCLCQLFYLANDLLMGNISSLYLNILFTLSLSIILCALYLKLEAAIKSKNSGQILRFSALFLGALILIGLLLLFCESSDSLIGFKVTIDYSIGGVLLPLFALVFEEKRKRMLIFSLGIGVYCLLYMGTMPYIWYSFLALPFLFFYSGERGKLPLKYFFYAFYPLHLGAIYLVKILFF